MAERGQRLFASARDEIVPIVQNSLKGVNVSNYPVISESPILESSERCIEYPVLDARCVPNFLPDNFG
jgi:hypothetical protein